MAEPAGGTAEPYVEATFESLYADEVDAMARLAFLMVGSEAQAEELVHDAFARLYERWDRVDNPGGYLRTCVVNGCKDRLRRRGVERRHAAVGVRGDRTRHTNTWPTCWPPCRTGSGPPSSSATTRTAPKPTSPSSWACARAR